MARIVFLHKSPHEYLGVLSLCAYIKEKGHTQEIFLTGEFIMIKNNSGRERRIFGFTRRMYCSYQQIQPIIKV